MALIVENVRVRVATSAGEFGADIQFEPGLNVIRAENTCGKSTCLMSMVYALGLEGAFSAQSGPPLSPSVTDSLEYRGKSYGVIESRVHVKLSDGGGRHIEVSRDIKSARDRRLITVTEFNGGKRDYFVRIEGGAQRERGFHTFLAEFVGWKLPTVPKYDGKESPLYVECLVPFFVVEQKSGWSQIEPKLPTRLGIRDMHARVVEFILNLDVQELARSRAELRLRADKVRACWTQAIVHLEEQTRVAGGSLQGYPAAPVALRPLPPDASIVFVRALENPVVLPEEIDATTKRLSNLQRLPVPTAGEAAEEAKRELEEAELAFTQVDSTYREAVNDLEAERAFNRSLELRLSQLDEDLRKYRDLERLKKFGSTEQAESWNGTCPTCHQDVPDALLGPNTVTDAMSVAENIEFIDAQIDAYKATKSGSDVALAERTARNVAILRGGNDLRGRIRALKETLTSANSAPSIASIREVVLLQERRLLLENLSRDEGTVRGVLQDLAKEWGQIQAALSESREGPSERDKSKVRDWVTSIREQLREYGFHSVDSLGLDVSWGSFRLEFDGSAFEKGISASDMVRCHWAYLLGLLEVAARQVTNHPLLLVFDEPRQQSAADLSFKALLHRASHASRYGQQVIVATSEKADSLAGMLAGVEHRLRDFGDDKVLQPVTWS